MPAQGHDCGRWKAVEGQLDEEEEAAGNHHDGAVEDAQETQARRGDRHLQ